MTRWLLFVPMVCACVPSFEDRPWRVGEARVLAIASSPAEARPGEPVVLEALVATPVGESPSPPAWSFCTRPRSARERTAVTQSCLEGNDLAPTGATAVILSDACARFGPNPPPTEGDARPQRAADPDPSGGYFVPVRAAVEPLDVAAFGAVRVRCDLAGATRAVFDAFEDRYTANETPGIGASTVRGDGDSAEAGDEPYVVDPGAELQLELATLPGAAEPYVVYDAERGLLVERREALSVRWYVTGGELTQGSETILGDRVGDGVATFTVAWRAPLAAGQVTAWAVVSDERGAVVWTTFAFEVGDD